jgi:hypothetical protein
MPLIFRMQLAARYIKALKPCGVNRSGDRLRPPLRNPSATYSLQLYDDLYLTEQPYGLVCGVEIDFPAND